jgi:hypothetical protein
MGIRKGLEWPEVQLRHARERIVGIADLGALGAVPLALGDGVELGIVAVCMVRNVAPVAQQRQVVVLCLLTDLARLRMTPGPGYCKEFSSIAETACQWCIMPLVARKTKLVLFN